MIEFPFQYKGRKFISVEHAYNSSKNSDNDFKDLFTMNSETYRRSSKSCKKNR